MDGFHNSIQKFKWGIVWVLLKGHPGSSRLLYHPVTILLEQRKNHKQKTAQPFNSCYSWCQIWRMVSMFAKVELPHLFIQYLVPRCNQNHFTGLVLPVLHWNCVLTPTPGERGWPKTKLKDWMMNITTKTNVLTLQKLSSAFPFPSLQILCRYGDQTVPC